MIIDEMPDPGPFSETGTVEVPAREALATAYQKAVEKILNSTPSKYIPAAKQEHERTKQIYRMHRKHKGAQK